MTEDTTPRKRDLEEARQLVVRAFAMAKASGREDWRQMTGAVLKNRLLDITDRAFDESDWGAASMRGLVEQLDDTVRFDKSLRPGQVVLLDQIDVGDQVVTATKERARNSGDWSIRRDLWESVIDCVSGNIYLWIDEVAVPTPPDSQGEEVNLRLPTTTPEELDAWRIAFATELSGTLDETLKQEIETWSKTAASSQDIPKRFRNRWFGVLKRHVRARLDEWFASNGIEPPEDWVTSRKPTTSLGPDETEHLRLTVRRAVGVMTRDELEAMVLPATVLARLLK